MASHSKQRRNAAGQLVSEPIQLPNGMDHVSVVRVDQVRHAVGVAGQMKLHDPLVRDRADELERIEVVVEARDVDVVDVQQQAAAGRLGHPREKFGLGHRRVGERDVRAGVLEHQRPLEHVLHVRIRSITWPQRLLGVGNRQQVVRVAAGDSGPADMVGDPQGVRSRGPDRGACRDTRN